MVSTSVSDWILAARPKTLLAAVSPVIIGISIAAADRVLHVPSALLALLGAVLIQIGTNFYNDLADFEKGADTEARLGPERAVQSGRISMEAMQHATRATFGAAVLTGVYLIWRGGWPVAIIGFSSILFGYLYTATRYSLADLGVADLFVFIFFGPIAVAGTYYVQALAWPVYVWVAGIGPGLLSVAILLVNNIRDLEEDRQAGRQTLVVRFGRGFGVGLYGAVVTLAAGVPIWMYFTLDGPGLACAASVIVLPAFGIIRKLRRTPVSDSARLNPMLGATAVILLTYSLIFSGAWLVVG